MTYGRKFNHLQELIDYINDIVLSKQLPPTLDLDGLTVIINDGSDLTVTFSGTALTPNAVVAQINAVKAGAASLRNYGQFAPSQSKLAFILDTLIVKHTGTANEILGLSTTGAVTVGANAIPKADIVAVTEYTDHYTIIHE
jgi:hypothetical protein